MNPIVNQLMGTALRGNPILQMFKTVMGAKNPNVMLQTLAQKNPQLQQTLDFINKNGGNAEQLFYSEAQKRDVDPETILSQLR